jgi:OFA family oxalate/formate antiporter-like MFS transporter
MNHPKKMKNLGLDGKRDPKGILTVIGSSAAIFWPGAFIFGFPGVMAPYWMSTFHVGRGAIGNILFFVLAAVGTFMFFVGRWQEKYGVKRMITIGAVICGLSLLIIAFASDLYMLYLWAFLVGTSSCFVYIPAVTVVQRWYPARRGLVSGIINFLFGFSAALMSPLFRHMFESMGYFLMIMTLVPLALLIGILGARVVESPGTMPVSPPPAAGGQSSSPVKIGESLTVRQSLRTRSFWCLWLTWAFQGAAGIAMVTLSTAYGLARGLTMESAVIILTAFNTTNGASRIIMGFLSDRVGRNRAMSLTFLAAGVAYFLLPQAGTLTVLAVLAAVIGFSFGTLFAVSAPLATDCFGLAHFGAIFGLIFTAYGFVSGILGPSLSGYLLDMTKGNYSIVFGYLGAFCLLSGIFIRRVKPPRP